MPLCPDPHHLAYTVAFDPPGSPGHSSMAKMLASSLLRTYFGGDIIVFRNSPEPLFRVERKGLEGPRRGASRHQRSGCVLTSSAGSFWGQRPSRGIAPTFIGALPRLYPADPAQATV